MSQLEPKSPHHKKAYVWSVKTVVIWVLMILLIVVFVLSFMMNEIVDTSKYKGIVGSVDRKKIVMTRGSDFYDYYSRMMEQYGSQGAQLEPFIKAAAFDAVVDDYVLAQAALRHHLYVFNEELLDNLQDQLKRENIDLNLYKTYDVSDRQRIELRIKNSLLIEKVEDTFFRIVPLTPSDILFRNQLRSFNKSVKMVYWKFEEHYPSILNEKKLKDYYQKNLKKYEKYGAFSDARGFVEADYINENGLELQDLILEKIRGDLSKKGDLSLEEIAKETKGVILNSKPFTMDSEKIDFLESSNTPSGISSDEILSLLQIPLHHRSDFIKAPSGIILAETVNQEIMEVSSDASVTERDNDQEAKELFRQYKSFLKMQHTIKRNF